MVETIQKEGNSLKAVWMFYINTEKKCEDVFYEYRGLKRPNLDEKHIYALQDALDGLYEIGKTKVVKETLTMEAFQLFSKLKNLEKRIHEQLNPEEEIIDSAPGKNKAL